MLNVSNEFKQGVKEQTRQIYGKVEISYTDPFLDQSITITESENANVSYPSQTADATHEPIGKILSLDGSCSLDGSYVLAPTDDTKQMGWWGSQLAFLGGIFVEPYPTLTALFFSRPIGKLKVTGDSKRLEYPVNFNIKLYNEANTLLHIETVINNTLIEWNKTISNVNAVTKMVLEITRWSHAGRQVKILEFITSIQETYEGDDIISISLLEEREVGNGSLPIGNISSNEISVKLYNKNRKFDAGNTQSPLYQLLKQNRKLKAWLGVKAETEWQDFGNVTLNELSATDKTWNDVLFPAIQYAPLGVFWTGDWNVPESDIYASTTGRDRLEMLRKSTYSNSTVEVDKTLYDLAIDVLTDAGLTADDYFIDTELQSYMVPYSYFDSQSHREALRKIAEACLGQIYCDRNGIIRIEGPSYLDESVTVDTITRDDYFDKNNPVKWSQVANYIDVETQPLRPDIMQEVYTSNEPTEIGIGEIKSITVFYNDAPCINAEAILEGVGTISEATYYNWGANIKVTSASAGTFTITINGQPMKILNKGKVIRKDDNSILDMGEIRYVYPGNPLVQTIAVAESIADKLLASFSNPRRDVEIDWRGNPAILLGDKITVADELESNDYYITTQNIDFDGGLTANLNGRRV